MNRRGSLEIERFACRLALALEFRRERCAARREKRDDAAHFRVVIFFRASREARRKAHFHFRIDAAGKTRIAANLDLAAPDFEQVEKSGSERIGRAARRERPKIKSVRADAPRGVAARIRVREADLEHGGRPQPHALAIPRGPKPPRVLPVQKTQFKRRPHDAVAHARRKFAQIQPLRSRIGRPEQARKPLPQIRCAQQVRLRANQFRARLDSKHGRPRPAARRKIRSSRAASNSAVELSSSMEGERAVIS